MRIAADVDDADAVVVCLGPWSRALLHPLGLRLKIYPIRGYSITLFAGKPIRRPSDLPPQARLTTTLEQGQITSILASYEEE